MKNAADAIPLRKHEVEAVEQFLVDKQLGRFAVVKKTQVDEDAYVFASDAAIHAARPMIKGISMKRNGLYLPEDRVVIDEDESFSGKLLAPSLVEYAKRNGLFGLSPGEDIRISWDDDDEPSDSLPGPETQSISPEEKARLAEKLEEERLRKEKEVEELNAKYEEERKAREEKIFFFYEQVDQVVNRISKTLRSFNEQELLHYKNLPGSQKESEGNSDEPPFQAVNFLTHEESISGEKNRERLELLSSSIQVDEMVSQLNDIADWCQRRAKESLHEEQNFFVMLRQVEEQEVEAEDSSKMVDIILQDKESVSKTKVKDFGTRLRGVRRQGKMAHDVLNRIAQEEKEARDAQLKEGIALLESQVAMSRAKLIAIEAQILDIESDPLFREENEVLKELEKRHLVKSSEFMKNIDKLQSDIKSAKGHVNLSKGVLRTLRSASERVNLRRTLAIPNGRKSSRSSKSATPSAESDNFRDDEEDSKEGESKEKVDSSPSLELELQTNPFTIQAESKPSLLEERESTPAQKINITKVVAHAERTTSEAINYSVSPAPTAFTIDSDDDDDFEEEEMYEAEVQALEEEFKKLEEEKIQLTSSQKELEVRLRTVEEDIKQAGTTIEREAALSKEIGELKTELFDTKTKGVTDEKVFTEQAQAIEKLQGEVGACQLDLEAFNSERTLLTAELQELESERLSLSNQLKLFSTSEQLSIGNQERSRRKSSKRRSSGLRNGLRGPEGDLGPVGDEWAFDDFLGSVLDSVLNGPCGPVGPAGDDFVGSNLEAFLGRESGNVENKMDFSNAPFSSQIQPSALGRERKAKLAVEATERIRKAYAAFRIDEKTGERVQRDRTNAQLVRSEQLCDILTREEQNTIHGEASALVQDLQALASLFTALEGEVEPIETSVNALRIQMSKRMEMEQIEIRRREKVAEASIDEFLPELESLKLSYEKKRKDTERQYEEELMARTKGMASLANEMSLLQFRLSELSSEITAREEHACRGEVLVSKLIKTETRLKGKVDELKEEIEESGINNPGQRAKRIRRQIKAMELENIKMNRQIRDLQAEFRRKQRDKKLEANARAAAIKYGIGQNKTKVKSQFVDDDETRQRKSRLRKQIRGLLQELARWRQKWQAAKKASSLAQARELANARQMGKKSLSSPNPTEEQKHANKQGGRMSVAHQTVISFDTLPTRDMLDSESSTGGGVSTRKIPNKRHVTLAGLGGLGEGFIIGSSPLSLSIQSSSSTKKPSSERIGAASPVGFGQNSVGGGGFSSQDSRRTSPAGLQFHMGIGGASFSPQKPASPRPPSNRPFSPRVLKQSHGTHPNAIDEKRAFQTLQVEVHNSQLNHNGHQRSEKLKSGQMRNNFTTRTPRSGKSPSEDYRIEVDGVLSPLQFDSIPLAGFDQKKSKVSGNQRSTPLSPETTSAMLRLGMEDRAVIHGELGGFGKSANNPFRRNSIQFSTNSKRERQQKLEESLLSFEKSANGSLRVEPKVSRKSEVPKTTQNPNLPRMELLDIPSMSRSGVTPKQNSEVSTDSSPQVLPDWMRPLHY